MTEPVSLEECEERRRAKIPELQRLQGLLGGAKGYIGGQYVGLPKWSAARAETVAAAAAIQAELIKLKDWRNRYHKEFKTNRPVVDGKDYQGMRAEFFRSATSFCDVMDGLMAEIFELRSENARLRNRLAAIDNPAPDAPGDDHDDWRVE